MKRFGFPAIFLVMCSLLCLCHSLQAQTLDTWFNPAWTHRRPIAITNPGGTVLTDFQVNVTLDSSFDFTRAKSDGSDIRFTSSDGVTPIPFWIEGWNPTGATASFWVKIPGIPVGGTTIYVYFGNSAASSASNGDGTFEFFDDYTTGTEAGSGAGYFQLGAPQTILVQDQSWEGSAPHTLSVVPGNGGGYTYWGYYGLQADCGGVGLAMSNDLIHWNKYPGNPLFLNGRWPSVLRVGGAYYMAYTKDFCRDSFINLAVSDDGVNFVDLKTLVLPVAGGRNQNPNLFYNPGDGRYYLYWYSGGGNPYYKIKGRSATTIAGLNDPSSETILLQSPTVLAAPNMLFYGGTYFLSTEVNDLSGAWNVRVYASASPNSGFSELPGNPVLADGSACLFQHVIGTTLHDYYCKLTNGVWTVEYRVADLNAGRLQSVLDSSKWTLAGGTWQVKTDTRPDGSVGYVLQGSTSSWQILRSSFQGGDYVLEAYGKLLAGRVWGLGTRVTDQNNLYSSNLYADLDSTFNLYEYGWANGSATTLGRTAVGTVDTNTWYKLTVKVHGTAIEVFKDNVPYVQTSSSQHGSGAVALYGEAGTVAEFSNVLVRKYAPTEPSATLGTEGGSPLPTLGSLSPSTATAGGSAFTLTVTGTNFVSGSTVRWNGSNRATTYGSASQLTAAISAADITTAGSVPVTVVNPAPGGGTSNALTFTIAAPTLTSLAVNPSSVMGGNPSTGTVTLSGPAPPGGATVTLTSSNTTVATVPGTVTVAAGSTSATFPVTTNAVAASTPVTITASYNGASRQTKLNVRRIK